MRQSFVVGDETLALTETDSTVLAPGCYAATFESVRPTLAANSTLASLSIWYLLYKVSLSLSCSWWEKRRSTHFPPRCSVITNEALYHFYVE